VAERSTQIESIQSITMEPNLSQLYQRRLKSKHPHLGEALWVPQTNRSLPTPYRQSGIRIGDVGLVNREGGFDFLFNICLPHDDPINDGRVPDNFEPLTPAFDPRFDIMDFPAYHGSGTCLTSKRIEHSRDNGWVVSLHITVISSPNISTVSTISHPRLRLAQFSPCPKGRALSVWSTRAIPAFWITSQPTQNPGTVSSTGSGGVMPKMVT